MRYRWAITMMLLMGSCLAGCHLARPYTILSRHVTPMQTVLQVEVPKGSTMQEIRCWNQDLKSSESLAPSLLISYYDGPNDERHLVASYEGGILYDMKHRR
ncbi:MAG: hypothetical protein JO316_16705 [Abitibacteriaceae bacterium]|nr:hypothetical protein [Abditibacteriaceae bacterium]